LNEQETRVIEEIKSALAKNQALYEKLQEHLKKMPGETDPVKKENFRKYKRMEQEMVKEYEKAAILRDVCTDRHQVMWNCTGCNCKCRLMINATEFEGVTKGCPLGYQKAAWALDISLS